MISYLYDSHKLGLSEDSLCKLMMDTLFTCNEYRNTAAHGGRIYNYESTSRLRINEIFGPDYDIDLHGLSKLMFLLNLFKYQGPYKRLKNAIDTAIDRHCSKYPEDITYLGQILNVNIIQSNNVWISQKSKKYHLSNYCSGLENATEMDVEEAKKQGYIPCKKCFK